MTSRFSRTGYGALTVAFVALSAPFAAAQVFDVDDPEVEAGAASIEIVGGITLDDVESGDEKAAYELSAGYGITSYWNSTLTLGFSDPEGDSLTYDAVAWENMFQFYHAEDEQGSGLTVASLYAALEVPDEGGFDEGVLVVGPAVKAQIGAVELLGNLYVDLPFENGADPGLVYKAGAAVPVYEGIALGLEANGGWEGAFGADVPFSDNVHVAGPAAYFETDMGHGLVIESRLALFFGLTRESPDTVLGFTLGVGF